MSDFPRGWTLSGGSSLVVPAVAGVVHVLDAFEVVCFNSTAAAVSSNVDLTSSDGVFSNLVIGFLVALASGTATDSGSGLDLAAGPGASLTIALSTAMTNNFIRVQGHDI